MIFLILFSQSAVCGGKVKFGKHASELILQGKCKVIIKINVYSEEQSRVCCQDERNSFAPWK